MEWLPHITVATIVEDNGKFLMVEELKGGRAVLNQPAGHLDPHETLTEAAVRETLEETGWDVEPTGVVGIYLYTAPSNGVTYQRVCFIAKAINTTHLTADEAEQAGDAGHKEGVGILDRQGGGDGPQGAEQNGHFRRGHARQLAQLLLDHRRSVGAVRRRAADRRFGRGG